MSSSPKYSCWSFDWNCIEPIGQSRRSVFVDSSLLIQENRVSLFIYPGQQHQCPQGTCDRKKCNFLASNSEKVGPATWILTSPPGGSDSRDKEPIFEVLMSLVLGVTQLSGVLKHLRWSWCAAEVVNDSWGHVLISGLASPAHWTPAGCSSSE